MYNNSYLRLKISVVLGVICNLNYESIEFSIPNLNLSNFCITEILKISIENILFYFKITF